LDLHDGERVSVKGVGGATHGYWPQRLQASAHGINLPRNYLVVDLCELEHSCKCPVDGLIGADFFDGKRVQIDFREGKIRLLKSAVRVADSTSILLKQRRGVWRVPVRVNDGREQWMRLDTGCATDLHWVNQTAHAQRESSRLSVALTEFAVPTAHTSVAIGAKVFSGVPTALHGSEIFTGESGLLGNGILSRFDRVTLDTKAGLLVLE
jgi:hypothetical protein